MVGVMKAASEFESAGEQLLGIIEGAIGYVARNPKAYRFFLHLQTQPEEDSVLYKYSQMLHREMSRQYDLQCSISRDFC